MIRLDKLNDTSPFQIQRDVLLQQLISIIVCVISTGDVTLRASCIFNPASSPLINLTLNSFYSATNYSLKQPQQLSGLYY